MLALKPKDQSLFVGIRSTFYRLSSIFGQGVLVVIAGILEKRTGDIPEAWFITLLISAVLFSLMTLWHTFSLPKPDADALRAKGLRVVAWGVDTDEKGLAMAAAGVDALTCNHAVALRKKAGFASIS